MRISLACAAFATTFVTVVTAVAPSSAQSPQSYPYCALDSSTGATSCYYASRGQCGANCIPNPSYHGPEGAMARARNGRSRVRR